MYKDFYVIDAHCHIYPEKIASKAVAGTDNFYGVTSANKGTISDLLERGDKTGVDHFIVQSVATTPKQVNSINEFISNSVALYPDRFTGLGTLHPESEDINGDIERLVELGLKGVKLHPDIQAFKLDDYRCLKIYEECEKRGLIMLLHTGDSRYDYSNPNRLLPLLKTYTNLTFIGAHFGGYSIWDEAAEKLCGIDNFYVDCSSSFPFIEKQQAKELIKRYTADKILFGTDYPMWDAVSELDYFFSLGLDECQIKSILSLNAKKVFNLE
ncbi:MAG: amidohydrolase [Clostridia bacterium]|nr:amidohydrolase [Clostridia bacterium]